MKVSACLAKNGHFRVRVREIFGIEAKPSPVPYDVYSGTNDAAVNCRARGVDWPRTAEPYTHPGQTCGHWFRTTEECRSSQGADDDHSFTTNQYRPVLSERPARIGEMAAAGEGWWTNGWKAAANIDASTAGLLDFQAGFLDEFPPALVLAQERARAEISYSGCTPASLISLAYLGIWACMKARNLSGVDPAGS